MILSEKRKNTTVGFGWVCDIVSVNHELVKVLVQQNVIPVFCAITHNGNGQLLNTNADTIASALAVACSKDFDVNLLYCFEKKGVLSNADDNDSVIKKLTFSKYSQLREEKVIHSGMLPKLENCYDALNKGVSAVYIGSSEMIKKGDTTYTR